MARSAAGGIPGCGRCWCRRRPQPPRHGTRPVEVEAARLGVKLTTIAGPKKGHGRPRISGRRVELGVRGMWRTSRGEGRNARDWPTCRAGLARRTGHTRCHHQATATTAASGSIGSCQMPSCNAADVPTIERNWSVNGTGIGVLGGFLVAGCRRHTRRGHRPFPQELAGKRRTAGSVARLRCARPAPYWGMLRVPQGASFLAVIAQLSLMWTPLAHGLAHRHEAEEGHSASPEWLAPTAEHPGHGHAEDAVARSDRQDSGALPGVPAAGGSPNLEWRVATTLPAAVIGAVRDAARAPPRLRGPPRT